MSDYLSGDSLRRQASTVVRLTVVTTLGLVWTIATGVLGMNIFDEADNPWFIKVAFFTAVFAPTVAIVLISLRHSKRLADFLDVVAEEGMSWRAKLRTLAGDGRTGSRRDCRLIKRGSAPGIPAGATAVADMLACHVGGAP